jgi:hypothetical protein
MRTAATKIFSTLILLLLLQNSAKAGCGGVCLGRDATQNPLVPIDSCYLDQNDGFITLYATYNSCCTALFGQNIQLVWYKDGVPFDTTEANQAVEIETGLFTTWFEAHSPGLYEVYFMNFQGANYTCGRVHIFKTPGVQSSSAQQHSVNTASIENNNSYEVTLYPNPSSDGNIAISYTGNIEIQKIELYDVTGIIALSYIPTSSTPIQLPTGNYRKGMYIVRLYTSKGTLNRKLLIE